MRRDSSCGGGAALAGLFNDFNVWWFLRRFPRRLGGSCGGCRFTQSFQCAAFLRQFRLAGGASPPLYPLTHARTLQVSARS